MAEISIRSSHGDLPVWVAEPEGEGPHPGVVVIHDALGMTPDLRLQAEWLAKAGFLAVAPDLYSWGSGIRCVISVLRDAMRRVGRSFDEITACREWLQDNPACSGKVGIVGFCMGGGFAVLMAPAEYGFSASGVNYGNVPDDGAELLANACPIVASYGARDSGLKGAAANLAAILEEANVPHDIKEYPDAGHSFMNNHDPESVPMIARIMAWTTGGAEYHECSAMDARQRIAAFFHAHMDE